jgi:hypothetical protein
VRTINWPRLVPMMLLVSCSTPAHTMSSKVILPHLCSLIVVPAGVGRLLWLRGKTTVDLGLDTNRSSVSCSIPLLHDRSIGI